MSIPAFPNMASASDTQPPLDLTAYVNISTAALQNLSMLADFAVDGGYMVSAYPTYVYGKMINVTLLTAFVGMLNTTTVGLFSDGCRV